MLEEAENERMHLLTFLELSQPSIWMRMSVLLAQVSFSLSMCFKLFSSCLM